MTAMGKSASAGRINLSAKDPCWSVAAAARLRAEEQARLADAAQNESEKALHLEQQDHFLALAGEYEALASSSRPEVPPSPARKAVSELTVPEDPFR